MSMIVAERITFSCVLDFKRCIDLFSQVNAGPLAYAQAFLDKSVLTLHPHKHIEKLQQVYREFIACCGKALEINDQLIKEDQRMYQEDMKEKYAQLRAQLAKYTGDEVCCQAIINEPVKNPSY